MIGEIKDLCLSQNPQPEEKIINSIFAVANPMAFPMKMRAQEPKIVPL